MRKTVPLYLAVLFLVAGCGSLRVSSSELEGEPHQEEEEPNIVEEEPEQEWRVELDYREGETSQQSPAEPGEWVEVVTQALSGAQRWAVRIEAVSYPADLAGIEVRNLFVERREPLLLRLEVVNLSGGPRPTLGNLRVGLQGELQSYTHSGDGCATINALPNDLSSLSNLNPHSLYVRNACWQISVEETYENLLLWVSGGDDSTRAWINLGDRPEGDFDLQQELEEETTSETPETELESREPSVPGLPGFEEFEFDIETELSFEDLNLEEQFNQ